MKMGLAWQKGKAGKGGASSSLTLSREKTAARRYAGQGEGEKKKGGAGHAALSLHKKKGRERRGGRTLP